MAITLETVGIDRLRSNLGVVGRQVFPKAAALAINRTADRVKTQTARDVSKFMGIKQKPIRDRLKVWKISPAGIDRGATVRISGSALNLIQFKARQVSKGVSAAPWGRRRIFPIAFIVSIRGTRLVMVRRKKGGKRVHRLPIRPLKGPGPAKTAADSEIRQKREALVADFLPTEFQRQVERLVNRLPK